MALDTVYSNITVNGNFHCTNPAMEYAICTVLIGLNSITQIEMLRQYCSAMLNSRNYKHQIILIYYVIIAQ
jgi:hypothetical protein